MAKNVMKTQGTSLYVVDVENDRVITLRPTAISGIEGEKAQIDTTDLTDTEARTYVAGLEAPGTASFTVQLDFSNQDHIDLYDLHLAGTSLEYVVAASDGVEETTIDAGVVTYPSDRSYLRFNGYISNFPVNFELDSVITSEISIQRSGPREIVRKV